MTKLTPKQLRFLHATNLPLGNKGTSNHNQGTSPREIMMELQESNGQQSQTGVFERNIKNISIKQEKSKLRQDIAQIHDSEKTFRIGVHLGTKNGLLDAGIDTDFTIRKSNERIVLE